MPGYTPAAKEQILRADQERASLRGLTRIFGVSRNTITQWLKKSPTVAAAGSDFGACPAPGHPGA